MNPTDRQTLETTTHLEGERVVVSAWDRRDVHGGCIEPGRMVLREFKSDADARSWIKDKGAHAVQTARSRPRDRVTQIEELAATGHQGAITKMLGED